jgi:hypothetical protein
MNTSKHCVHLFRRHMYGKLKINKVKGYCHYHHIVSRRDAFFFGVEFSVFIYLFWSIKDCISSSVCTAASNKMFNGESYLLGR